MEELMSVADASEGAGVSRQRILQVIEAGDLKAQKIGRNYVILKSDFLAWNSGRVSNPGRPTRKSKD